MKEQSDLVRGLLRKAESDLRALDATLEAEAYDAAAFHAQQAAEKYLKAFLAHAEVDFPYTHNLAKLVELCAQVDASFVSLIPTVESLTPYAVELRYDSDFWPDEEAVREARSRTLTVKDLVLSRMPADAGGEA
jgi:HEPN domain-containing protein